jgi:glycosyltransferase involved in cell wall biosynthesis
MNVAYIAPARNKRGKVEPCVMTMLQQTYMPMHLVFSDQGSTDGTYEEIEQLISRYDGHHEVSLLRCPRTEHKNSMYGINAHINWIVDTVPADIYLLTSIDDFQHPLRAERTLEIYKHNEVSMVNTCQRFYDPLKKTVEFSAVKGESRRVSGTEVIDQKIGGSCSLSFTGEFFKKIGGLPGGIVSDVYMSYIASQDKGLYYLAEPLHTFVLHHDANNTGLGGAMLAAEGDPILQRSLAEKSVYQISTTLTKMAAKTQELFPGKYDDDQRRLIQEIANYAYGWCVIRDAIEEDGLEEGK